MPYIFTLHSESLKRKFAVYVVVAKSLQGTYLYVGKTGDNNEGCNPLISRCGNHFSYNDIHSQVRNKIADHESYDYTYIFEHFADYYVDEIERRRSIDLINEMERWLNQEVARFVEQDLKLPNVRLLNKYYGKSFVSVEEKEKRLGFRNIKTEKKIGELIAAVKATVTISPSVPRQGFFA